MGCGCSTQQRAAYVGSAGGDPGASASSQRRAPGSFLATTSTKDFVRSLSPDEQRDKKRLVVWFRMQKDGSFDEPCRKRPDFIFNKAIAEGVPLRFRWLFFRSVTDYKIQYRTGAFDTLVEKGRNTLMRSLRTIASTPLRTMNAAESANNPVRSTPRWIKTKW